MIKVALFGFLFSLLFSAPRYNVEKIWLFSRIRYQGNVPNEVVGKQLKGYANTLICIIQINKKRLCPTWQVAYYKGDKYSAEVLQVDQDSIIVGRKKNTNALMVIKAEPNSKLIQLSLTDSRTGKNFKKIGFSLYGMLDKKLVYVMSSDTVTELSPILMQ